MLSAIDLFAGAGGLSVGLKAAGFSVLGSVELDPTSAETYRMNHPKTKVIVKDIRRVTGPWLLHQIGLKRGELDLLTGCPPCQGFSTLRTRRRASFAADPRNDLVHEFLRLVRSIRPRAVLLENVPGLETDPRFEVLIAGLSRAGYQHDCKVLNAKDYGVPQRRKRLVLIALRGVAVPEAWTSGTIAGERTVRDAIGNLPEAGTSGDPLHDRLSRRTQAVMARIRATPKDGGSRSDIPEDMECDCHSRTSGYFDVYGRMVWDAVAPTITSGCHNPSKGRYLHPEADRSITLREAALLQSFPSDYQFSMARGKEHVAWQIGNAFPPTLIAACANALKRELGAAL